MSFPEVLRSLSGRMKRLTDSSSSGCCRNWSQGLSLQRCRCLQDLTARYSADLFAVVDGEIDPFRPEIHCDRVAGPDDPDHTKDQNLFERCCILACQVCVTPGIAGVFGQRWQAGQWCSASRQQQEGCDMFHAPILPVVHGLRQARVNSKVEICSTLADRHLK